MPENKNEHIQKAAQIHREIYTSEALDAIPSLIIKGIEERQKAGLAFVWAPREDLSQTQICEVKENVRLELEDKGYNTPSITEYSYQGEIGAIRFSIN